MGVTEGCSVAGGSAATASNSTAAAFGRAGAATARSGASARAPCATLRCAAFLCTPRAGFFGTTPLARAALPADLNLLLQNLAHGLYWFGFGFQLEFNLGRRR